MAGGATRLATTASAAALFAFLPTSYLGVAELGTIAEQGGKAILLLNRRGIAPALRPQAKKPGSAEVLITFLTDSAQLTPESRKAFYTEEIARYKKREFGIAPRQLELLLDHPELHLLRVPHVEAGDLVLVAGCKQCCIGCESLLQKGLRCNVLELGSGWRLSPAGRG